MVDNDWHKSLHERLEELLKVKPIHYSDIQRRDLPELPGVYLITSFQNEKEYAMYVGRTRNILGRIYRNHLMGNIKASSFKRYLCHDNEMIEVADPQQAKTYIRANCQVRFILESEVYMRGMLENYFTAVLKPRYGIVLEH